METCAFIDILLVDVMYETMAVYSFSWIYYLTFIFLTTFAFLNMVIGIVVNVMENEHAEEEEEQALADGVPTIGPSPVL